MNGGRIGTNRDLGMDWDELGRIGNHWDGLGRIGANWDGLGRIGTDFDESGRIGTNQNRPRTTWLIMHELDIVLLYGKNADWKIGIYSHLPKT